MKILYGIIGALVAFAALALIVSALPIPGNYQFLVVRSGSMEPAIKQGAVVVVKPSNAYQIGDIITFRGTFRTPKGKIIPVSHMYQPRNGTYLRMRFATNRMFTGMAANAQGMSSIDWWFITGRFWRF